MASGAMCESSILSRCVCDKVLKGSTYSMKLRYKKLIIIFTVAIMFIGLGTFSLIAPSMQLTFGKENTDEKDVAKEENSNTVVEEMSEGEVKSRISLLITNYLDAKQRVDMEEIAECVTDASHIDNKRLVAEAEYIENYKNIECTIKNGAKSGEYRVYVYYEVKVYDIDILIPSLTAFYIQADENGEFKIYLSALSEEAQTLIDKLDNSEEIQRLVESVQKSLQDTVSSNEEVREFYEMLESSEESNESVEDNENIDQEGQGKK